MSQAKPVGDLDEKTRKLIRFALKARRRAYAPYSKYRVGCALLDVNGKVHTGCNVEIANFGGTICAERTAAVKMVSRGVQRWRQAVIVTASETPAFPCGDCRQFLNELGPDGEVFTVNERGTVYLRATMKELLPHSYGKKDLESGATK